MIADHPDDVSLKNSGAAVMQAAAAAKKAASASADEGPLWDG